MLSLRVSEGLLIPPDGVTMNPRYLYSLTHVSGVFLYVNLWLFKRHPVLLKTMHWVNRCWLLTCYQCSPFQTCLVFFGFLLQISKKSKCHLFKEDKWYLWHHLFWHYHHNHVSVSVNCRSFDARYYLTSKHLKITQNLCMTSGFFLSSGRHSLIARDSRKANTASFFIFWSFLCFRVLTRNQTC